MFDFHKAITAFHDEIVTLPQSLRTEMKERRDANRKRIDKGLENNNDPTPYSSITQGSYAMKTMIQDEDNDYDIDDGIYFKRSQLKTAQGNDETAITVRQMICDALTDDRFNDPPEVKTNCVRVNYGAGYHVDIPIYRTKEDGSYPELASAEWMPSNARDVKEWFDRHNQSQSPDSENGRQLRRITRLVKRFAKSRKSWKGNLPSGFALTILVCEQFHPYSGRDDISLYETMRKIHDRLKIHLDIWHPKTLNTLVNSGVNDAKTRNLKDRLYENLTSLGKIIICEQCKEDKVAGAWGAFFDTRYFKEFMSRVSRPMAVAEVSFAPLGYSNKLLPPPQYWDGQAGINIVRQQGKQVLDALPFDLRHVVKPSWSISNRSISLTIKALLSYGGKQQSISSGDILPKSATISFSCFAPNGLSVPKDYLVRWQVVNTCKEAAYNQCLRGGFEHSKVHAKHEEETAYCGIHWVEAFLIRKKDGTLCGRSGRFFVVIDG
jgi:hypothetical protein